MFKQTINFPLFDILYLVLLSYIKYFLKSSEERDK